MKKRWLILIILLVVIFLVIILTFSLSKRFISEKLCDLLPEARTNSMFGVETVHPRANCYYDIAVKTKDYTFCEVNLNIEGFSKDICYSNFNLYMPNIEICKKMSLSGQIGCFSYNAEVTNNPDVCEIIYADSGENSKDQCYQSLASSTNNILICDKIKQKIGRSPSKDSCYNLVSWSTKNPQDCDKITDINLSSECYGSLATVYARDVSICEKIKQKLGPNSVDSCYIDFIYFDNDHDSSYLIGICEKVSDIKEYEVNPNSISGSHTIVTNEYSRDNCYYKLAYKELNLQICEKMKDEGLKADCIKNVKSSPNF